MEREMQILKIAVITALCTQLSGCFLFFIPLPKGDAKPVAVQSR